LNHTEEITVGIFKDYEIVARFVPPWIASGSHLDEPFNLSFPVLCVEVEMQPAPFA
jgi:hypothetical protein